MFHQLSLLLCTILPKPLLEALILQKLREPETQSTVVEAQARMARILVRVQRRGGT